MLRNDLSLDVHITIMLIRVYPCGYYRCDFIYHCHIL
jgi:hypothetical protein